MKTNFLSVKSTIWGLFLLFLIPFAVNAADVAPPSANSVSEVVSNVEKSVVNVQTDYSYSCRRVFRPSFISVLIDKFFEITHPFAPIRNVYKAEGTGVVIDSTGTILTNEHVVRSADRIRVLFSNKAMYAAKLIGRSRKYDLALLKIESEKNFQPIQFGDSKTLKAGDDVIAIGNPYGYRLTVTRGIVSGLERELKCGNEVIFKDLIQTDAALNPGNSGGPLLNLKGQMLGLINAKHEFAEGIGFAIPAHQIQEMLPLVREQNVQSELDLFRKRFGFYPIEKESSVFVSSINRKSNPSLIEGDKLVGFNGKPVGSIDYLLVEAEKIKAKERIEIIIERNQRNFVTFINLK